MGRAKRKLSGFLCTEGVPDRPHVLDCDSFLSLAERHWAFNVRSGGNRRQARHYDGPARSRILARYDNKRRSWWMVRRRRGHVLRSVSVGGSAATQNPLKIVDHRRSRGRGAIRSVVAAS